MHTHRRLLGVENLASQNQPVAIQDHGHGPETHVMVMDPFVTSTAVASREVVI